MFTDDEYQVLLTFKKDLKASELGCSGPVVLVSDSGQ